jgi:hypothetical protein
LSEHYALKLGKKDEMGEMACEEYIMEKKKKRQKGKINDTLKI